MPEGGKVTPISSSIIARVTQAARYVITGNADGWFPAGQPLKPQAPPEVKGRQFDYSTYVNTTYTPRASEPVSFADLRGLADNCDILSAAIETRKDQMEALDWNIRIAPDDTNKRKSATAEQQKRIDAITEFFQYPDKVNTFEQWQRQLLDDMFIIDAPCLYKRRDRKGRLFGLELIDGSTIKILLDDSGRRPLPPDPAYQQIIKGIPATNYTSDELLYLVHNPRTHKVYGRSHVEQVLITVNTLIRRALHQLEYYREGSQPDAFLGLPKEWTTDQIRDFQKNFDAMMAGNLAMRRRLRFMPGEFKYQETKPPQLKDEYDEWLARIVCYVFSLPPTPFIKQMNRATAESSHDAALEEGLAPLQKWMRKNMNRIIAVDFDSPDLEFAWVDDREQDPLQAAQIREGDTAKGIISIDEARQSIGLDPLGGAFAVPMALTATGYVAVKSPEEQQADNDAQQQATQSLAEAHAKQGANNGQNDNKHGGGDEGGAQDKTPPKGEKAKPEAGKVFKGLKKKPNPYLLTTGHRHEHRERA
ncbi:phage portal protein [Acidicapsa acidisoli]|uniref:phage portal protein n=1 Tax=Acidicapsa acidisoli TaxID=1615681 RepID=UPI0021E0B1AC|nr:phage portal protein [Acidicapsa acidisoli]